MLSQKVTIINKCNITSKPIDIINNKKHNENSYNNQNSYNNNFNIDCINTLGDQYNNLSDNNNYKLDSICFDPSKFSPPDEWSKRLKKRIRNYQDNKYQYIDYLFDNK